MTPTLLSLAHRLRIGAKRKVALPALLVEVAEELERMAEQIEKETQNEIQR